MISLRFRDIIIVLWVVLISLQAIMVQLPGWSPALDLSLGYAFFLALGLGSLLLTLLRGTGSSRREEAKNKEERTSE